MTTLDSKETELELENPTKFLTEDDLTPENFGSYLKQKRNELGQSLEEVHKVIHVNIRVLRAFEANQFTNIEDFEAVYLRMYLKKYSHYLGIPDTIIDKRIFIDTAKQVNKAAKIVPIDDQVTTTKPRKSSSYASDSYLATNRRQPSKLRVLVFSLITLVIVACICVVVYQSSSFNNPQATVSEQTTVQTETRAQTSNAPTTVNNTEVNLPLQPGPAIVPNNAETATQEQAQEQEQAQTQQILAEDGTVIPESGLFVKFKGDVWTQVTQGKAGQPKVYKDGQTLTQPAGDFSVVFGNLTNIAYIYYNGQKIDITDATPKRMKFSAQGLVQ
ncbi:helix-turn-helix domain-containing protein [Psittacicella hinzii]|nr:helix-turn-helix domain-containing protein [Psittacicella hinzii]